MGVQAKRVTPEVMSRTICIFIIVDMQTILSHFIAVSATCKLVATIYAGCNCIFEAVRLILSAMATAWTGKTGLHHALRLRGGPHHALWLRGGPHNACQVRGGLATEEQYQLMLHYY